MEPGSYFIRHTDALCVKDEDLKALWDDDRIAVHYPYHGGVLGEKDSEIIDPEYYKGTGKTAMKYFHNLKRFGGYIWAESFVSDNGAAKIGFVEPGTKIKLADARWDLRGHDAEFPNRRDGDPAILKTMKLSRTKSVGRYRQVGLRAGRPRQGTIARWGGQLLADLVEGHTPSKTWTNLSTAQQEAACAEFLRLQTGYAWLPKLRRLLLPVGRTLQDVDVYGYATDGNKIFAQVTYYRWRRKEALEKAEALKSYRAGDAHLVFFGRGEGPEQPEFFTYVDAERLVMDWIREDPGYEAFVFES